MSTGVGGTVSTCVIVLCVCEMFGDVINSVICVCVRCLGMSETMS